MIFDKPDIYSTLKLTSGSFLGNLRPAICLSHTLPTHCYTEQEEHDASVHSLVCLLPLLMCQAEAAPEPRDRLGVQPVKTPTF